MLQTHIQEKHQTFLTACENGDTKVVKDYLKENGGAVLNDHVAYEAACIASQHDKVEVYKQLIEFHEPCIHAARSVNREENLSENNECLKLSNIEVKKYNRSTKISNAFENFKIMGQMALGLTALAVVEVVKVGATLVSELSGAAGTALQINKLREKAFSGSKDTNKPDW